MEAGRMELYSAVSGGSFMMHIIYLLMSGAYFNV